LLQSGTVLARISAVSLLVLILLPFSAPFQTFDVTQVVGRGRAHQNPAITRAATALDSSPAHVIPVSRLAGRTRLSGSADSRSRVVVAAVPFETAAIAALTLPPQPPQVTIATLRI
jgi:hypothetical protein